MMAKIRIQSILLQLFQIFFFPQQERNKREAQLAENSFVALLLSMCISVFSTGEVNKHFSVI